MPKLYLLRLVRLAASSAAVTVAACHPTISSRATSTRPDTARLAADVRYLASDALEGRGTGTPGNDSARAWIGRRFASLGLRAPFVGSGCATTSGACRAVFSQDFTATPATAAHSGLAAKLPTGNVAAIIPGGDPLLRGQIVVLGAHMDHLGRSSFGALDPERPNEIHNGADDNASGVATILEIARLLRAHPPRRSVAVVAFSGEELGLLGSQYFVDHSPFALDSVQAMLNFDMVGRLRDDKLLVYGVATASELERIVDSANVEPRFKLVAIGDGTGPSDHSSFYLKNLPVLHFFTDIHDDYHRASDDAGKTNAGGMARIAAYVERITRELADRPSRLTFVRAPVQASPMGDASRTGAQVYLGSIPDMGATEVKGLRLSGVRAGSPAEDGGLQAGDVIIELDGAPVADLYSYTDALYSHKPGDRVVIIVLRKSERVEVQVTLGRRGG